MIFKTDLSLCEYSLFVHFVYPFVDIGMCDGYTVLLLNYQVMFVCGDL